MKLETEEGESCEGANLWLILTESEARDLAEGLVVYFSDDPRNKGWHHHVGESLTLGIEPGVDSLAIRMGLDGNPL
jgi:hypothetical protein